MRWEAPWLLLLLLLVPLLAVLQRGRPAARPAAVLWVRVAGRGGARAGLVRAVSVLPWAALTLALVALARPQQGLSLSETESRGVDIMLAIDMSTSMEALDPRPNRLLVAKETAREFIRRRPHDRIGLTGFAATAFTQCPLTLDHKALAELLDGLDFGLAKDGTAIGMGLATAVARLRASLAPSKVIVLLTDGDNNAGQIDPLTGADLARALGVKVYTILLGRGGLVPVPSDDPRVVGTIMRQRDVDPFVLQQIARRTGGRFYRATDAGALAEIYGEIDRLERVPVRSIVYRDYREMAPHLLGAAALLLAVSVVLGNTVARRLP